jgi:chemotaxis protein MotB
VQPERKGSRRRHDNDDEHESHPLVHDESNWLVSYADLMTLLFGFFVLMYSFSRIDKEKFEVVRKDMVKYFGGKLVEEPGAPEGIRKLSKEMEKSIGSTLSDDKKQFNIKVEGNNIVVSIASDILFPPGSSRPSEKAIGSINKIYESIKVKKIEMIEVEGHTDSDPISTPIFPSNWELSTSRAASIVRIFENLNVPPSQLKASGYAASRPLADDLETEGALLLANKQANRRVVLNFRVDPENADILKTLEAQGIKAVRPPGSQEVVPDSPNASTSANDLTNLQKLYDETKKRLETTTGRLNETKEKQKKILEYEKMINKTTEMEKKALEMETKINEIKQKNEDALLKTQEKLKQNEKRH